MFFIGAGGAGNVILDALSSSSNPTLKKVIDDPTNQCFFYNTSDSDMSTRFKGTRLVVSGEGTGRDRKVGEQIIKDNISKILNHLEIFYLKANKANPKGDIPITIISSLGGGSGSSFVPAAVSYLAGLDARIKITLVGILSSAKEGVSTLPNGVKSFQSFYNDLVVNGRISNFIIFDNEKFEKDYGCNPFDITTMNKHIVEFLTDLLEEDSFKESVAGYQTIDLNEKKRVMFFGKGIADYLKCQLDIGDEVNFSSSIFAGKHKLNTAKAAYIQLCFSESVENIDQHKMRYANEILATLKKKIPSAFVAFGYSFKNKELTKDIGVRFFANGMEAPQSFMSDVKTATKLVTKNKKVNKSFEIMIGADLDI